MPHTREGQGKQGQGKQRGRPRVALFVTCLADVVRPRLGFAALQLLEQSG